MYSPSHLAFTLVAGTAMILTSGGTVAFAQEPAAPAAKVQTTPKKASIYDKTADAQVQIAKASGTAKREEKRILVMFGGDWCGWCHKLHELFASDAEIRKILSYEYVLVMVDTTAPNAEALLTKCQGALSKEEQARGVGYPFLSVLDSDGKVVKAQRTDPLEEGNHHDPARVKDFLNTWKTAPKDANDVLRQGLARATSEDKRVFLAFGAPWCGWCHELDNWMSKPEIASILDRDFVIVHVDTDRMTGGKELLTQYRPTETGGIPWFAILDSKGKAEGTSDGPRGNIGYPYKPEEIDQFMTLIAKGARHIEPAQQTTLRQSLRDSAERIDKERKARRPAATAAAR